ncbi:unnamed protein product [Diatraea saccharalis]|uniref:chitinase n=1 Tax=Diatraea saccharalis TaxID=40085 RepID=A0A9N9QUP2_9NEOP|nr:unnamed protein product [Diatraea saccharalis]
MKLGGGMVWALDLDDFKNRCGEGNHPLLNAIKNGLLNPKVEDLEIMQSQMRPNPTNSIDEEDDLDDIMVPIHHRPTKRPIQTTVATTTTRKPTTTTTAISTIKEEPFKIVCYYTNWAWYRPDNGKYTPDDIDPEKCTHIVYAFAVLDMDDLIIKPHDIWLDVENKFYEKVASLKVHGIKVLLGLGGWDDSAGDKYSRLVNNPAARRKFAVHAIDFIQEFGFDGLDLDWEYPKCWQVECEKGPYSDKQGFSNLVKELHTAFYKRGLLLSAAVSASKRVIDYAYDVPTLSENLDWIALMTYDYHGQWDKKTGHVAPMYVHNKDDDSTFNVNYTVHYWMDKGATPQKLVLGVPFYGQTFSLVEGAGTELGAPTYAGGEAGDETRARGFLAFYEICERIRVKGWRVYREPGGRMGPYATDGDQWVSFDDDWAARHKAQYVRALQLGGAMVWSMDLDDFTGKYCGCGRSPLLANINHVLRGKEAPPPCTLEEIQAPPTTMPAGVSTTEMADLEYKPAHPESEMNPGYDSGSSLDGKPCSGVIFKGDNVDCSKYYICMNGIYLELTCPAPLVWDKNHCEQPEKSSCRSKANLRIPGESKPIFGDNKPIIGCYFTNWAYYRHGNGSFGPEQIDPSLCTHIIYAWAHLDYNTYNIIPGNPELDIDNDFYGKITNLRLLGVKVIIGVGGLEDSEDSKWAEMAASPKNRKAFVESALKFLKRWNFDGLQLAWQYPVCNQMPCTDFDITEKENYSILIAELSKTLHQHNYELSAMVSSSPEIATLAYDPEILTATLDWISLAANDYYASKSGRTAYLVPLETVELAGINSFNSSLAYWTSVVPQSQIVVGVPAYARSYTLRSAENAGVHAPVTGPGIKGRFTMVPGFLAYYEICPGPSSEWKETQTEDGTYAVRRSQWASYLSAVEVHRVGASGARAGLRGAALWALDLDDWQPLCTPRVWPLLNALRQGLHEPELPLEL